jgi:hypothetical protein
MDAEGYEEIGPIDHLSVEWPGRLADGEAVVELKAPVQAPPAAPPPAAGGASSQKAKLLAS